MRSPHRQPRRWLLRSAAAVFVTASLSLPPSPLHAGLLTNELIQNGRDYLARGDYERAIDAFSKVLAVDPRNKEAKGYLKQMGLEDGLYTPVKRPLHHIADMAEKNIAVRRKIKEVSAAYERLEKLNRLLEKDRRYLHQAVRDKEIRLSKVEDVLKEKERQLKLSQERQRSREQELALVQNNLMVLKETLAAKITALKDKEEQLNRLRTLLKSAEDSLLQKEKDHTARLRVLKERFASYRAEAERTQQALEDHIRKIEERLRRRGLQLGSFRNKLIATEFKLTQRERQLVQKSHEVIALRRMITELESQLQALQAQWGQEALDRDREASAASLRGRERKQRRMVDEAARKRFHEQRVKLLRQLHKQLEAIREDLEGLLSRRGQSGRHRTHKARRTLMASIEDISRRLRAMQDKLAFMEQDAGRLYRDTGEAEDLLAVQDLNHRRLMVKTLEEQVADLKDKIEQEWQGLKKTEQHVRTPAATSSAVALKDADFHDILNDIRRELTAAEEGLLNEDTGRTARVDLRGPVAAEETVTMPSRSSETEPTLPTRTEKETKLLAALRAELAAAKKELAAMEDDVIDETVDELSREYLVKEQSDVIKALEKELAAAKEKLASAKREDAGPERNGRLKQALEKIALLQAQLEEARRKLSFLKEAPAWTLSTERLERLRDRLSGIKTKMEGLFVQRRRNLEELKERYEHLKSRLNEVQATLLERNQQIQALEEQLEMILAIGGSR